MTLGILWTSNLWTAALRVSAADTQVITAPCFYPSTAEPLL